MNRRNLRMEVHDCGGFVKQQGVVEIVGAAGVLLVIRVVAGDTHEWAAARSREAAAASY